LVAKERPLQKKLSRELFNFFVITILIKIFLKEHKNGVRLFKYLLGGEIHHDSRLSAFEELPTFRQVSTRLLAHSAY
jgi:hypothetical protein